MMKIVERPGAMPAPVWQDRLDPGPEGRPMLLFFASDNAMIAQVGADPDEVHLRHHVDHATSYGLYALENGHEPAPPEALTPELLEALDRFAEMDRDRLAEVVLDETHSPFGRMLAYDFYLDTCTMAEMKAQQAWQRELDPGDFRDMLHGRN